MACRIGAPFIASTTPAGITRACSIHTIRSCISIWRPAPPVFASLDDARQARRNRLLAVDRAALAAVAHAVRAGASEGYSAVIASRAALEAAAREMPALGARVLDLPE